ncbi:MAG: hypothetical protein Q8M07_11220 [Prosthecobacter sp.]|nr:hypothetical protein [Prosthecobacter sp.]
MTSPMTSAVAGGVIPLPQGFRLADGAEVLILPLDWMRAPKPRAVTRGKKFVSEDLVGCHKGNGRAATNMAVRERLRGKRK